jgi:hypothetical protein
VYLAGELEPGDVLVVMSNGSFDGLCEKLLELLPQAGHARPRAESPELKR